MRHLLHPVPLTFLGSLIKNEQREILVRAPLKARATMEKLEVFMPYVSIALVKESNKRLSSTAKKDVVARSSKLSKETINGMMKRAYERLSR